MMMNTKWLVVLVACVLTTGTMAQLDGQNPSVINVDVHPLQVTFGNIAFDNDHLTWTVTAPYIDYTWAGAPEFQSNEDLLGSISPDGITGTNPFHPVLMGYLDFSVGLDGPHTTPRTSTYFGSCAQAIDPVDIGGDNFDVYLRNKITNNEWITAAHPGQYLFDTLTHPPPAGGWLPSSDEGLNITSVYTVMNFPSASGTTGTAGSTPFFIVTGLSPSSDGSGRHMLTYHVSSTLTALRECTASAEQTPVTGPSTSGGHFLALFQDQDDLDPPNSRYTIYPTWVGLEPTTALGAQGGMRSHSQRVTLTISSVGHVAQISGAGRGLSVSIVDAVAVTGNATSHVGDTEYGCPTIGGTQYGRILLELELMHTKEDRFNVNEVVGIEELDMIQPSIGSPFVSGEYENCYGMPIDNSMNRFWKYQSLDNWVMSNRRLPGGSREGAADLTMKTCGDQAVALEEDPYCNENGAPFCPQGTVNGHGVCFQRVLLTSQCLPLNVNGNTLTLDSVCPHGVDDLNTADGLAGANDDAGMIELEFPVTVCSTMANWVTQLDTGAAATECTRYSDDPDRLVINLQSLKMYPALEHTDRVEIDMQFLVGPESNDFDTGLSPVADLSNPAAGALLSEERLIARYQADEIVTAAVRTRNDAFLTILPLSINRLTICRGPTTDMIAEATSLASNPPANPAQICGPNSVQEFVFYDSALGVPNTCTGGPCIPLGREPKIVAETDTYLDQIHGYFRICNNPTDAPGGFTGFVGCDATSINAQDIIDQVGLVQEDEVYMTVVEVYVGEANSPARRRMLSVRDLLATTTSEGGGTIVGGQLFVIEPASETTVEGVGTFSITTDNDQDTISLIIVIIVISFVMLVFLGLLIKKLMADNASNCSCCCQGYNKLDDDNY